jgi:hypothetical protein
MKFNFVGKMKLLKITLFPPKKVSSWSWRSSKVQFIYFKEAGGCRHPPSRYSSQTATKDPRERHPHSPLSLSLSRSHTRSRFFWSVRTWRGHSFCRACYDCPPFSLSLTLTHSHSLSLFFI